MFKTINNGAKWCVHILLSGFAMVVLVAAAAFGACYIGIALFNNWLMSK